MISTLSSIKNKSLTFLEGQLGAVAFEYVLIIGGVSVVVVGLLAVGGISLMRELIIEGICETMDDVISGPSGQWWCHGGPAWTF